MKKEALKELIPPALAQTVKDVIMFLNMNVDTLSAAQVKTLVMERISGDVHDQVIRMDGDQVESREQAPQPPPSQEAKCSKAEWANSLGYGPQQGAIGKSGKGKVRTRRATAKAKTGERAARPARAQARVSAQSAQAPFAGISSIMTGRVRHVWVWKGLPWRKRSMRSQVEEIGQKVKARAKASLARAKAKESTAR